ncbi:VOC family protein [Candidatus Magnetaquicoccus inordinatus]|uniref:VOC family protein n=1 Tax=Candidatus Magnetaquicoccus inordinatus TaxID=2496818 RepID=UPI00102CA4D2|nr:VOC family protein [Candidatus Magnetaquicoccus inordinatus]
MNTTPTFSGIHHSAFATSDIKATLHFWRDLLGMRLILVSGTEHNRQYLFDVGGNARLSFFEWPGVKKLPYKRHGEPVTGPYVFDHLAIAVAHLEQLWNIMALLDAGEFPASDVIDHGYCYSIYSYDPNGIPIEFTCDNPSHDLSRELVVKQGLNIPPELLVCDPLPGCWPKPQPILPEERVMVEGDGKELYLKV